MSTFNTMAAQLILRDGQPVREGDGYYGWTDYDYYWHIKGREAGYGGTYPKGPCEVVLGTDLNIYEEYVSEFAGTDASSDNYRVMELHGLTCACGARKDVTWRYRGEMGDTVRILADASEGALVPQFVPKDEVDTMIALATQHEKLSMEMFQAVIMNLADTYANKAADPDTSDEAAKILALCSADLLWAVKQAGKRA
jgi:hypothetical protein